MSHYTLDDDEDMFSYHRNTNSYSCHNQELTSPDLKSGFSFSVLLETYKTGHKVHFTPKFIITACTSQLVNHA